MLPYDKEHILASLKAYRETMSEFDLEEMNYLIGLVEKDINK